MLKSIGLMSVLAAAVAAAAYPPGDGSSACPGGKCGAATAACSKECGQCPAMTASKETTAACTTGECAKACSDTACKGCPATVATSKATACADGKCCAVATSAKAGDAKSCAAGACSAECKDCPVTVAMKQLPQLTYQVGTEKTSCPKAAAELAKKSNASIQYVVADKSFDSEADAKAALVDATEQFVAAFVEPKVCKESGNITVAGQKACCEATAAQISKVAKEAMDKVKLTYLVGEKSCSCPIEAAKMAKDSGDATVFCIGEEKTQCKVTARLNLARAKYKAAVLALMQAESATKPTSQNPQGS